MVRRGRIDRKGQEGSGDYLFPASPAVAEQAEGAEAEPGKQLLRPKRQNRPKEFMTKEGTKRFCDLQTREALRTGFRSFL
jgi:hypothetical protein